MKQLNHGSQTSRMVRRMVLAPPFAVADDAAAEAEDAAGLESAGPG